MFCRLFLMMARKCEEDWCRFACLSARFRPVYYGVGHGFAVKESRKYDESF